MKKAFILAVALFVAMAGQALAADSTAKEIAAGLQNIYGKMQSFTAEFDQKLTHQESGSVEARKGTLAYKKPLLVKWETVSPEPELMMVTEKEIWNYLPAEKLAYRYNLVVAQDSRSVIKVITGQSPLNQDFDVERLEDENSLAHLMLYPKDPAPELTEAQIWVDTKSFLIKKVIILDFYGNTNEMIFKDVKVDAPMPAGTFTFTPPKGIEVEDHITEAGPEETPLNN